MNWEIVIGLEIHVQLNTQSKIFSGSPTQFGAEPNTQANAIDMAMPGTLPVVNKAAIEKAALFGLAIEAEVAKTSIFDRKNYFYADLPKGYQTTQLDKPIVGPGHVDIALDNGQPKRIRIHHAHLEEDAGKSIHDEFPGQTAIDLNRAGTPLIEIVTEPDMRSATEAVAFLRKIHTIITYIGISDGDMSQGSMRCDANVSVRLEGDDVLGTRTEIKNINSFRFVDRAIRVEAQRQIDLLESGGKVIQETRLYDSEKNETRSMRSKEVANDYRYFPCPDLLPVVITEADLEALRAKLPELPEAKTRRFVNDYNLSQYDASQLSNSIQFANFFEACSEICNNPKLTANWMMGELSARLNSEAVTLSQSPITAESLAELIARIDDGTISSKIAKTVFDSMWADGLSAEEIIDRDGLKQNSDSGALEAIVDEVINNSAQQVANYLKADPAKRPKMLGFFVGQVMKASKGQANPGMVNQIINQKLSALAKDDE